MANQKSIAELLATAAKERKPVVRRVPLGAREHIDELSCSRTDGTHCQIYGPCIVVETYWPDGGITQQIEATKTSK